MILTHDDIMKEGLEQPLNSEKEVKREKKKKLFAVYYREDMADIQEISFLVGDKHVELKLNKGYVKVNADDTALREELEKRKFVLVERLKEIAQKAYVVINQEQIGTGLSVAALDGENIEFINGKAVVTDDKVVDKLRDRGYYVAVEID